MLVPSCRPVPGLTAKLDSIDLDNAESEARRVRNRESNLRPGKLCRFPIGVLTTIGASLADQTSSKSKGEGRGMNQSSHEHRGLLQQLAHRAMLERGLQPEFPTRALDELEGIPGPARAGDHSVQDLRALLWCSIDNDDSRDLDQLTVCDAMERGAVKVLVAVADVSALVERGSAIDGHARTNTTSVYTAAEIFPMLPERLSTDLTSLNPNEDRLAVVVEMVVAEDGSLTDSAVYRATVYNHAKLAYNAVAAWLEGEGPMPEAMASVPGLAENLRRQDEAAQALKRFRFEQGALDLETIEGKAVFSGDRLEDLREETKNRAKELIADFMIAANGVTARFLEAKGFPSVRRIVKIPKRWDRIVEIAAERDFTLPSRPDSKALDRFLHREKTADPLRFPDLSLTVIKLMGAGEYGLELPGGASAGHFGLAVRDYTHSTAPNRRYPDLITQRLLKAALAGARVPYSNEELADLARHCTAAEDAAKKVERQVEKSAAALLLQSRIGEQFDAIVTGASEKGTWVRLLHPPIEGKLTRGFEGVDVGRKLRVELIRTDVEQGYIDFKKVKSKRR